MTTADHDTSVQHLLGEWASSPSTHPRLGDWRQVGYRRGVWPPPEPTRLFTAKEAGVLPGEGDNAPRLQSLVDEVGADGGGVIRLEEGRYKLSQPIIIRHANVVLRGSGRHSTRLHFTRPLRDALGDAPDDGSSCWSWTGGQVWFVSEPRFELSKLARWSGRFPNKEGWLGAGEGIGVYPASRGDNLLTLTEETTFETGEMVMLEVANDPDHRLLKNLSGDVAGAAIYDWKNRAARLAGNNQFSDYDALRWPVVITEVLPKRQVRLEQPLRVDVHGGASLRRLQPTVHDSGVESLTIENELRPQTPHNMNPGSNGVCMDAVYDCWVRDVHVLNADVAFALTSAKSCHLAGISAGGRSLHHFVACRVQSHDNLIEDFELESFTLPAPPGAYLHGVNVEGLSSGNVYRRGVMHTGTFDSHRQLPFENLRTDITITNENGVPGGARDAGPYFGARNAHWGIEVTNGNNLCIDISDMAPSSVTVGITGLERPGSELPQRGVDFEGDLQSQRLAFGHDLGDQRDLLEVQRKLAPVHG